MKFVCKLFNYKQYIIEDLFHINDITARRSKFLWIWTLSQAYQCPDGPNSYGFGPYSSIRARSDQILMLGGW